MKKVAFILGSAALMLQFQNCSKITAKDIAKQQALETKSALEENVIGGPSSEIFEGDIPGFGTPGSETGTPAVSGGAIDIKFICPNHLDEKKVFSAKSSGEVKLVRMQKNVVLCEIHNVRNQMLSKKRQIDVSSCPAVDKSAGAISTYLVKEGVTSNYKEAAFTSGLGSDFSTDFPDMMGYNFEFNSDILGQSSEPKSGNEIKRIALAEYNDAEYGNPSDMSCPSNGDPLLIQLGTKWPQRIGLSSADDGVYFDLLGQKNQHRHVQTAWFTNSNSANYFVVLPDAQGQVLGIDQLFGDNTLGPDQLFSKHGFEALAKHDLNRDQVIDREDQVFAQLKLWKDDNLDGIAQTSELHTLSELQVKSIDLKYDKRYKEIDRHGNMVKYKSVVEMEDESYGLVFDLWLTYTEK